ncbi:hypothetical protein F5Y16DRAFT_215843 [Xylariaceae sp. FL0255]|nr:hypothetical protein F5Y16DRAFT_215843 [Xylariaceae sp. FL0255]
MGLLDFISKKSVPDLAGRDSLKTSAYDATVAQQAPIRGKYPVAGNGAKILEEFQRSHPQLRAVPRYTASAQRLRNDSLYSDTVDRPSTAPSNRRDGSAPAPSASSQTSKKHGPYKLPSKIVTDFHTSSMTSRPAPSPSLLSEFNGSIRSGNLGRPSNYVDLLDAQSTFKPSDFHSRVKAAGAKNYGEDVADRNIEQDGGIVPPLKAPKQFAVSPAMKSLPVLPKDVDDDSEESVPRPRNRRSTGPGPRSKYAASPSSDSYPKRTSSRLPPHPYVDEFGRPMSRTASARSERAARRKSEISSTVGNDSRASSRNRRGKDRDRESFPDDLRDRARATSGIGREFTKPNSSNKRQSFANSYTEMRIRHERTESEQTLPDRPKSSGPHSRRKSYSHAAYDADLRMPAKRQSLQGLRSSRRGEIYEDTYYQRTSFQGQQFSKQRNPAKRQLGSTTDLQGSLSDLPAQQPEHHSQVTPSTPRTPVIKTESSHSRNRSIISISSKSITARDIENSIPERASSLGRISFTASETAISTLSSNPFRPQSGHTPNTSIDIPASLFAKFDSSIPPIPDIPPKMSTRPPSSDNHSVYSDARSIVSPSQQPQPNPEFSPDEHFFHDGSERSSSPSSGSFEKNLLFLDAGYGMSGAQLPGLSSLFDAAVPPTLDSPTRSPAFENQTRAATFQMPAYMYSDHDSGESSNTHPLGALEDDVDDDDFHIDIPTSRPDSRRRYAYGA